MTYVLGHNQYGKAEVRVVRVFRDQDPHELVDYNVSVALTGDFAAAHTSGDNTLVLTTDAMKNTVFGFAKEREEAVRTPEGFGLALAEHFVQDVPQVATARVKVEQYPWRRAHGHPHAFVRSGEHIRTATVTHRPEGVTVVSGLRELTVLKTTDSEFHGFYTERFTTLAPTTDRIMATSVTAQWCHADPAAGTDWDDSFTRVKDALTSTYAAAHSLALQHTLWDMGRAALDAAPEVVEVRLSCPNKHHFVVDLAPFGLENDHEVHHADDRPYGLIEATIARDASVDVSHAYDPGQAW
ncbi:MAG TPA: urate oxidase [Ornithinicoccus sp.]|jgi:urate oxidase|nr:urate oxidase [Ornithinicoccus sp.]